MRRVLALSVLLAAGGLTLVAAGEQSRAPAVRIRTLRPGDILYVLLGSGGNSLALMRDEGVVLIDTKLPGSSRGILNAIEAVTDKPVTTIVNTHAHVDHTGSNGEFPAVKEIVAHEKTKVNMQTMQALNGQGSKGLPTRTFADRLSLLDGPDRIDLYYFGAGHTDGDVVVVFPQKRIAYFGDLFPSKSAPVIDTAHGGSGVAFAATLARAVAEINGITQVVTGHEEGIDAARDRRAGSVDVSTPRMLRWSDVQEYAEFNRDFLAAVRQSMAAGKSARAAAATLTLPEKYKDYDMRQARANVEAIYAELK